MSELRFKYSVHMSWDRWVRAMADIPLELHDGMICGAARSKKRKDCKCGKVRTSRMEILVNHWLKRPAAWRREAKAKAA